MSQPPRKSSRQAAARGRVGIAQTMTPGGRARNQAGSDDSANQGSRTRIQASNTQDNVPAPSQPRTDATVIHRRTQGRLGTAHNQGGATHKSSSEQLDRTQPDWDSSCIPTSSLTRSQLATNSQPMVNKTSMLLLSRKEPQHHFYRTPSTTTSTLRRQSDMATEVPSTEHVPGGSRETSARDHLLPSPIDPDSTRLVNRRDALLEEELTSEEKLFLLDTENTHNIDLSASIGKKPEMTNLLQNEIQPMRDFKTQENVEDDVLTSTHVIPDSQGAACQGASRFSPTDTAFDENEVVIVDFEIDQDEVQKRSQKANKNWGSIARLLTSGINTGVKDDAWGRSRVSGGATGGPGGGGVRPGIGAPPTASAIKLMRLKAEKKKLNRCQMWTQKLKLWWKRKRNRNKESPVFRDKIRNVEGRFGSGVAAFLLFVRHLLMLDVVLAVMWLLLVILPQAIYTNYTPIVDDLYIRNLLDGGHGLAKSWWFYGNYDQEVGRGYPMGLVYLLVTLFTYFGGLFVVFRGTAQALEEEGGAAVKDTRYTFCRYVFTSWDYALTNKEAVHGLSRNIASLFRDHMSEIKTKEGQDILDRRQRIRLIARRVGVWILTFLLISLGCTAIVFSTSSSFLSETLIKMGYHAAEIEDNVVMVFGPTVIFMLVNAVVPMCIYELPKLEKYSHPKTELHISIGRVFVLHMANLMSLVVSTYLNVGQKQGKDLCPGTLIGQELYKLVILDTIVGVIIELLPMLVYYYWTGKKQEFDMASAVLTVIERQAVIWLGTLVCPVMPLVGVVTLTSMCLTYYFVITLTCCPPSRRWNQPRRNSFLMGLTVITLLLLLGPVSIAITRVDVINLGQMSDGGAPCGPFGNQSMTHLVVQYSTTQGTWLAELLDEGLSPTILLPVILLMMAVIYYQSMRVRWEKRKRNMLAVELLHEREETKDLSKQLHGLLT